jgi:hypothetical protein
MQPKNVNRKLKQNNSRKSFAFYGFLLFNCIGNVRQSLYKPREALRDSGG